MNDVNTFGKWFNMSKPAVNPKNMTLGRKNANKPRPDRKKR